MSGLTLLRMSVLGFAAALCGAAAAQNFPSKPIRIVVPYPPGGPMDPLLRSIQPPLTEALGQQIVVENRPGATGMIGMAFCAQAAPDGYTLCTVTSDGMLIIPRLRSDLPYNVERDFTPVVQMVSTTTILVSPARAPFNDFREMVAYAKANPGKLNYGSFGMGGGGHQLIETINKRAGVRITHVPYKGSGPAVQAAVAAEVDLAASTPQVVGPMIQAGKLKGIAIITEARNPKFPDIKTYKEQGYDVGNGGWFGLVGPGKMPKEIVDRLNREVVRIIMSPAQRERIVANFGADPIGGTAEDFVRAMKADAARADELAELLRVSGYKPE
jgi:tripartite-type tricarboxylate transporter receptor subunit TctC